MENVPDRVNNEIIQICQKPQFLHIMQKASEFETATANVFVETDEQEAQAVALIGEIKRYYKDAEVMRKSILDFPNNFVKSVNALFKGTKTKLENQEKRVVRAVQSYKRQKEEAWRREVEEKARQMAEQAENGEGVTIQADTITPDGTEEAKGKGQIELPKAPEATTRAGGTTMTERQVWKFEIVDPLKLIRGAIGSNAKVPDTLVKIDETVLRKMVTGEELTVKQFEKYGVKVWQEKQAAVKV